MAEKAKKVGVTALKYHTLDGKEYHEGDTYDVDETHVGSLAAQGMAKPTEEVEQAEADAKADEKAAKAAAKADEKAHKK